MTVFYVESDFEIKKGSVLGFIVITPQSLPLLIFSVVPYSEDHPISCQGLRIAEAEKEISRYKTGRNMIMHLPCLPSPAMSTSVASQRQHIRNTKLLVSCMISMAGAEITGSNTDIIMVVTQEAT
jgi:hypothetical protein